MEFLHKPLPFAQHKRKDVKGYFAMTEDQIQKAAIAGFVTGTLMALVNILLYSVLTTPPLLFIDYALKLTLGYFPVSFWDIVFGALVHILFSGLLGLIFSLLIHILGRKHIWLQGSMFGLWIWFFVFVAIQLNQVNGLSPVHIMDGSINAFLSVLFGLILAGFHHVLNTAKKEKQPQ